jgi:DNA-binding transcriptional ArsR family regulator
VAQRATTAASQRLGRLVGAARARILVALDKPRTTTQIAESLGIAASTASEHLTALAEAGVLTRERAGREVLYELSDRGRQLLALMETHNGPDHRTRPRMRFVPGHDDASL